MPYSSKTTEATDPFPCPLIPEDAKPEACRRLRCRMTIRRSQTLKGVWFGHDDGRGLNEYVIPLTWLDDVNKDIWADIRPWMESLHEEAPGST